MNVYSKRQKFHNLTSNMLKYFTKCTETLVFNYATILQETSNTNSETDYKR